ncbi:MAG: hypothetical protein ABIQ59_01800 [Nocardioidaceae bacterium]
MRIEVDSGGFVSAVDDFYQANHGVVEAMSKLTGTLGASGAMAGDDTGGQAWAEQYDQAAGPLVEAGCQVGESMAQLANLLNASLSNHEGADFGSRVYGPQLGGSTPDDTNPDHWSETLSAATPPSAYGGTGDQPGWWHWIAGHIGGLLWPDADTGRLREAGDAWRTAGQQISSFTAYVDSASGQISAQRSKEVPHAVTVCSNVSSHMTELSTAYTSIGQACSDYAQQVDEHHHEIEGELKSFVEWTIGIEVGGAILGAVTLGIGEAAAQAAEAAKVAEAAAKVISILNRLIELARLAALRIGEVVAKAAELGDSLRGLLSARQIKALEETGEIVAKESEFLGKGTGFTADGAIDAKAFATEPDSAFFWSGRTNGVGGQHVAADVAGENGGTTLEQLMESRGVKMPEWDPDNPAVVKVWKDASSAYAEGASGEVRAVIGDSMRPGNVWETAELPSLMDNPAVTRITTIDPVTGATKVVYP